MPQLPHPKKGENKNKWISRCMADPAMTQTYPNDKKRNLQCQQLWNGESNNMIYTEQIETSEDDLNLINQWTLEPLAAKDVYTFSAKVIDDQPTANDRVWSQEWQTANTPKFLGIPVITNHDTSDANLTIGRIYHAEQKENAIHAKIFVPLNTESGREAATKIKNGQYKAVSINAKSKNTRKENDLDVILPSQDDRILEVSFVSIGGCKSCTVTNETSTGNDSHCECGGNSKKESALIEFANAQLADVRSDFVRTAAFLLGTSIKRQTYQELASDIDPNVLREVLADFKRAYETQKTGSHQETTPVNNLSETFKQIRQSKGV